MLKTLFKKSKPSLTSISSLWESLGTSSTKQSTRKRSLPVVSDAEIRERKAFEKERAIHKKIRDADRQRGVFGYSATVKKREDVSLVPSRTSRKRHVNRVFSQSLPPNLEEEIRVNRLKWNSTETTSPLFRSWGRGFGWYNARKIVLAAPNPEFTSHQFYPDLEGEGFGTWKPNQKTSNILSFEVKLTRDIYRAFARLQESEGFVPGLIDTKEVLYKDDFRALLTCLGAYPTEDLMNDAFARADTMGKGWISYRRFLKAKLWILSQGHEGFDYHSLFDMLDVTRDGTISIQELTGLTTASGHVLTPAETAAYFKEVGKSLEDVITRDEFIQILSRRQDLAWILRTGYRVVFVMGPPASGKGTYCEEIKKRLNINHVSTGELLREEVAANSTLGKRVAQIMKRGDLVDSSTATVLLQKYLRVNSGKHVLVDGFPRSMQNSTDFLQLCGRPEFALMFDAPDEVLMERMRNRAVTSGRDDDKDENTSRRRIEVFRKANHKIVENLINSGVDVYTIDATLPKEENVEKIVSLMRRS